MFQQISLNINENVLTLCCAYSQYGGLEIIYIMQLVLTIKLFVI